MGRCGTIDAVTGDWIANCEGRIGVGRPLSLFSSMIVPLRGMDTNLEPQSAV